VLATLCAVVYSAAVSIVASPLAIDVSVGGSEQLDVTHGE
jgi:hypothetical protein